MQKNLNRWAAVIAVVALLTSYSLFFYAASLDDPKGPGGGKPIEALKYETVAYYVMVFAAFATGTAISGRAVGSVRTMGLFARGLAAFVIGGAAFVVFAIGALYVGDWGSYVAGR